MRLVFNFATRCSVANALIIGILLPFASLGFLSPTQARETAFIPPEGVVSGPARVIDGDTLDVANTRIRLEGIDAPETGQTCQRADGSDYSCGTNATRALIGLIAGHALDCYSRGLDKYGRMLAICFVGARDLNAEMVRQGHAWAFVKYSKHYIAQEAEAQAAEIGIWQGPAQPAWEYRAKRWAVVEAAAPEGCAIKGNVSTAGNIYHMPWSPWYQKVSMGADKGKRWFCSEAEALAAGWRPASGR
jgi:endonuclease YncB( thermonuclease family)